MTVFAEDDDKFFVAYSASQASNLPDSLKRKMTSTGYLDNIALMILKQIGEEKLASEYYNQPILQDKLRKIITQYIGNGSTDQLFDDQSTQLFSSLYSIEELQSLYQLNSSTAGKAFVQNYMKAETSTQNFIDVAFKQKFDKTSSDKLEADVHNAFKALSLQSEDEATIGKQTVNAQPSVSNSLAIKAASSKESPDLHTTKEDVDMKRAIVVEPYLKNIIPLLQSPTSLVTANKSNGAEIKSIVLIGKNAESSDQIIKLKMDQNENVASRQVDSMSTEPTKTIMPTATNVKSSVIVVPPTVNTFVVTAQNDVSSAVQIGKGVELKDMETKTAPQMVSDTVPKVEISVDVPVAIDNVQKTIYPGVVLEKSAMQIQQKSTEATQTPQTKEKQATLLLKNQ